MGRRIMKVFVVLVAGLVAAGVAWAGVPDPNLSNVPNVLYTPGGSLEYRVMVAGDEGPIDSALVQIVFSDDAAALVCWCTGQEQPIIEATTDAAGEAVFFIAGGGCINPDSVTTPAVEVFANGFWLAEVGAVSPDAVDINGDFPWQGWNPGGICTAATSDAVTHTPPIKNGVYSFCTDMDSDLVTGLSDAILITTPISTGEVCNQQ